MDEWIPMEVVPPLVADEVHVWRAPLDRPDDEVERRSRSLSADETERADRFRFKTDRRRYVVGRGLLRTLLGSYSCTRPDEVRLWYTPLGKPGLVAPAIDLRFNVSHSEGLVLIALALGRDLGVDLERMRDVDDWRELAGRFFAPREVAALDALPEPERTAGFFACWTRKEAYVKATGLGLTLPLDSFAVSVAPDGPAELLATDHAPADMERWTLAHLTPAPGYFAALGVEGAGWRMRRMAWTGRP